ncbi:MAG TPA: NADH-quinone oxidoreductase subunit C [Planctomycetota bacterium]|nr:NADH-quinone oxidoreductase subunit C [Planctomycetota bacterium]
MEFNAIVERLKAKWPGVEVPKVDAGDPFVILPTDKAYEILEFLKNDPELYFDSLMTLAGADSGRELWVVYPLHSMKHKHRFMAKIVLGREKPECDSVCKLWGVANFFEREAYDLYGIIFKNHPDLRRIINPPDWVGWPGRKDYDYPADYHGIPTLREDQFFSDKVEAGIAEREEEEKKLLEKLGLAEKK